MDLQSIGRTRGCSCRGFREARSTRVAGFAVRSFPAGPESSIGDPGLRQAGLSDVLRMTIYLSCELSFFFDELFAVSGFVSGDDFVGQFIWHDVVVRKLHRIAGACLGH